nr:pyrophosphate--fructose 6-phosphate 1-phosphotransferase subunit alpha [Tanacetum cinerariifolium]
MFEKPDGQDVVWTNQRSVHGLALVKSWKLLTSCSVHIITLSTIQLILLVERRYLLLRFTLEQLVNVTRLQVEEESKMSLELLRILLRSVKARNMTVEIVLGYRCARTEQITPDLICLSTYQLLQSSGGDSGPDLSFDKSSSLKRGSEGSYDLLGQTKDQIRTTEQVNASMAACNALKLDGLVIVGGLTLNSNATQLSKTFSKIKCPTKVVIPNASCTNIHVDIVLTYQVVGVPVTLNGDLKNHFVKENVDFDTIRKVNSQLISNVCTDALSANKGVKGLRDAIAARRYFLDRLFKSSDLIYATYHDKEWGVPILDDKYDMTRTFTISIMMTILSRRAAL